MNVKHLLLGILMVAVFAVGLAMGRFGFTSNTSLENKRPSSTQTTDTHTNDNATAATSTQANTATMAANMSDEQKRMLNALGIDINKVTPTMIACAETSLGASRTQEIKNGATPSFGEGVKLVACYK